jgi:hypothetical protein
MVMDKPLDFENEEEPPLLAATRPSKRYISSISITCDSDWGICGRSGFYLGFYCTK